MNTDAIYITGASGFIGNNLAVELQSRDFHDVTLIQRKSPGSVMTGVKHFFISDISDNVNYSALFKRGSVIIHMAALAHVVLDKKSATTDTFYKINVEATVNLAKHAAQCGVKRFIFLSSVGVNGSSSCSPFTEESEEAPHDIYTKSKLDAELKLKEILTNTDVELVIIRPPVVYGVGAVGSFGKLLRLVSTGLPLPFGSVSNHRSLIYVKNLVDFIIKSIDHPEAANQTFLVSDGDDVSLRSLITLMRSEFGCSSRLLPIPLVVFKLVGICTGKKHVVDRLVGSLQIDSSKARNLLKWVPPYSVEQGIAATVQDFKNRSK